MSLELQSKNYESAIKLLVKYIQLKHTIIGSLKDDELDFLKCVIALGESAYQSVLHGFNKPKASLLQQINERNDSNTFLKAYHKYYDVQHNLWGEHGLCGKGAPSVTSIEGKPEEYARIEPINQVELQTRGYSGHYRNIVSLNVPWYHHSYEPSRRSKIVKECVFKPHIVTFRDNLGDRKIKGLYVRVDKSKAIEMLKKKGIYGTKDAFQKGLWGVNSALKFTLDNISREKFRNTSIHKDMKFALTPVNINNSDKFTWDVSIPEQIYKHHDGSCVLKRYQLANVDWMLNIEKNREDYSIDVEQTVEVIPRIYYDHCKDMVYEHQQSCIKMMPKGGGLFDEVGLGKTLTCITLISSNPAPDTIGCTVLDNHKLIPVCQAWIKSGKKVKENKGKPVRCGKVIKEVKSKPKKKDESEGESESEVSTSTHDQSQPKSLEFLLKHKVCATHARGIKETSTETKNDTTPPSLPLNRKVIADKEPQKEDGKWMSRATLVICPNQIPYQWKTQIQQYTKPCMKTFTVTTLHEARKITYRDIINADVVITTIDCIERGTVTSVQDSQKVQLDSNCPVFTNVWWHRVIIDEIHKITNDKYQQAIFRIFNINSTYRWAVTGTPFQKDPFNYDIIVSWLFGDTRFHGMSKYRSFSKLQSHSDVLRTLFRCNTKKSTANLQLDNSNGEDKKKLWQSVKQTEIWLDLSKIERAMYNARRASKGHWIKDRDDEYLRQICCHPNLNAENSKIVNAVHTNTSSKYATDAMDVKTALLNHNSELIKVIRTKDIPSKAAVCWRSQALYLADKKDKKIRMSYYGSVHQLKRTFLKLYQLLKSERAYKDVYNTDNSAIVLLECDSCFKNVETLGNVDIHVGECSHVFCSKCASKKTANPFVDITSYTKEDDGNNENNENNKNNEDDESKQQTKKQKVSQSKKKEYERKIIDGYAECKKCGYTSGKQIFVKTIGMTDIIKNDETELLMDINTNNDADDEHENEDDNENAVDKYEANYIPRDFKDEMDCAISLYGTKIAHLVAYLKTYTSKPYNHRIIIFSQWDNLLSGIGDTLKNFDLPAMTCKGNVMVKRKAIRNFKTSDYYKIILISSKHAAEGLDLIEADKVILVDPIYGDYDTVKEVEDQAIGRSHRLGQQNPIEVVRLLIKNTIEEECYKEWITKLSNNK